ncbi:MAG: hypothetical protein HY758_00590 [Nitrospirae bacterium]|nr:hypothetical protein [Nitrospirota bacterium]
MRAAPDLLIRISLFIIIFFLPRISHASDTDLEKDLQRTLEQSNTVIERAKNKLKAGHSITSEITQLKNIAEEIRATHLLLKERFSIREEQTQALGAKAQDRHRVMSEGYS